MYPEGKRKLTFETDDTIYFFSNAFDPLNNWSAHAVTIWGKRFPTLEHAYHYRKFDGAWPLIAKEIAAAPSPWAAMQTERKYKDKRREDWQEVKLAVMEELLRAKISQNQDVADCLKSTGIKKIVENSPWDSFWGSGPNNNGRNKLGKLLMKIRKELTTV